MTRFTGATIDSLTAGPLPGRAALAVVFTCLALGGISSLELNHVSIAHGQHMAWGTVLPATMPRWILLAAMLPIVLRVGVSPSRPRLKPGTIVLHLALFLVISWMHAAVTAWAMGIQSPVAFFFPWSARFLRA